MKTVRKILKWTGITIGSVLGLMLLAGLVFRLVAPRPQPPGELVDMGGFKMHINSTGKKSHQPTVVIETGQALPSEHYHWLSEGLKDSMRVVRYDRAGIAYSELSHTPRDPATIAKELHDLLEKTGESPPYIMVGHSFGGLFIRVFAQMYPDEVAALVFLDSSHPDQRARMNRPVLKPGNVSRLLSTVAFFGDLGLLGLYDRLNGSILYVEEFPDEINDRFYDYTLNGRYYRGYREEIKWDAAVYDQSRATKHFGALPVRVFTAAKKYGGKDASPEWMELQGELAELSSNSKHVIMDAHHNSIYTSKENADVICREIMNLLRVLRA